MDSRNNLIYIDALKGIAMLGVIMVHFTQNFGSGVSLVNSIGFAGARCPQLFFIISAFLTWRSMSKHGGVRKDSLISFYKGRVTKIAPLYYLALVLAIFIPCAKYEVCTLDSVISHISFTNALFPELTNNWLNVEWYIADLALFYVLVPLLYKYAHNLRSSIITFVLVTFLNVVFTTVTNYAFVDLIATSNDYEAYFHTFCIINQLPVLMMGVVLYYGIDYIQERQISIRKVLGIFASINIVVLGAFIGLHLNKSVMTSSFIAGMLFSGLFLMMSSVNSRLNGGDCPKT